MTALAAVPLFLASLAVTLFAAQTFARRLDRLGVRFGFPEAMIGLLTALAADGPEISSALFALARGAHSTSVGVLVGSNAFNLAAMIGLSGVLAGGVRLARETLLLEGMVGLIVTLIAVALLLRWIGPVAGVVLAGSVVAPYVIAVIGGSEMLLRGGHLSRLAAPLERALSRPRVRIRPAPGSRDSARRLLSLAIVDVALIIAGSFGMVAAALALGDRWHVSRAVLGTLVLAPLTSIPNAVTGVRLGRAGRSAALVGETFNSNTINLGAGVIVPALLVNFAALSVTAKLQLGWLVAMTVTCLVLLGRIRGLRRGGALLLVLMYVVFVVIEAVSG